MKRSIKLSLQVLTMILIFTSCQKDRSIVYVNQNTGNTGNNVGNTSKSFALNSAGFFASVAPKPQKFIKDAASYMSITSSYGNNYVLPPNSLLQMDNTPVTGNVEFVLIEYVTKADMLKSGVTTLSGQELLSSGSMFYMTAYQNGEELKVKDNTNIHLKLKANSNDNTPMDYWVGEKTINDSNNKIDWKLSNSIQISPTLDTSNLKSKYNFQLPNYKFGYSNLDCLIGNGKPKCKNWSLDPPDNCNDKNSVAMIIMNQYNGCGYAFWSNDVDLIGTQYRLPIGEPYKILIYRKYGSGDNDIEYVILNEVVKETSQVSYKGAMTKTTQVGLSGIIDGL